MFVNRVLEVPTGHIVVADGEKGKLEFLSLGDYGKDVNLNQHKKVDHQPLLPLSEKWVVTISTQYGCSMGCKFCDVPKVGPGRNATFKDMVDEVCLAMALHPEVRYGKRLNVHFARMGEPTWNHDVLGTAYWLKSREPRFAVHPVVSTMMPRNNRDLEAFLQEWMYIKNDIYGGDAGLQLSVNSTDEEEREKMFNGNAAPLYEISSIMLRLPDPKDRKITLNFAVADYKIDALFLAALFPPDRFIVKLTPMHKTTTALANGIQTIGDYTESYPYEHYEEELKKAGFDVLVFIASAEEDLGRITCGNAILSGTEPMVPFKEVK
jgi:23S rRNA (adenine2503-C2)-methyltransferase